MSYRLSRRVFLSAVAAFSSTPVWANAPLTSLRPMLRGQGFHKRAIAGPEQIIEAAKLGGRVTFAVANAQTGALLESESGTSGTPPASVTKAVTALYALDALGPGHRFTTQVIATGGVSGGVVQGDLVLVGGADPTLDSNHLAALAGQLKAAGIREVRGKFRIYDGALPRVDHIDAGQPDHVGYNPAISGISLNFNRVHFEWRRGSNGYGVTMDARTNKYRPEVAMSRMRVAERDIPVYTFKATPTRDEWTVSRRALGKGGSRWLPVRLPGLYAGDVFRTMARTNGIALATGELTSRAPKGTVVAQIQSAPLQDILRDMLRFSNNLIAEMVGLAATVKRSGKTNSLRSSASEMNRWAGANLGMKSVKLVDHSGLGDASRMSATEMCGALVKVRQAGFRGMLKPIAMRDAKGRVQKTHPLKVHAKTGTLNFVSALAGYMTVPDGTELAFAIFAADEKTRSRIKKANREAPQGARGWNKRAKTMQQRLIERWGSLYNS
ncbi:MAG: D-alanyl-D-alanine carboxypeptidase/D-alanyl-D-alanine-endopeptidase [Aliishimia sp.]